MKTIMKRLALGLTLALCLLPINAALALAETGTTEVTGGSQELVNVTDTTTNEETTTTESTGTETTVNTGATTETTSDTTTTDVTPTDTTADPTSDSGTDASSDTDTATDTELPPVLDENGDVVDPGTLPDSPFYWLTMLIEKLQVILTVDPVEKTELIEEQALERMAEAQELIETGDTEVAEEALQAYSAKIAEAQAFLEKLTETDSEMTQKLETALSQTHAKNIQTLGGLLDKLPPQASEKVALNIVRSMEKSIAKMDKKEQQKVAKELRKATQGVEDTELTEEDQEALETLEALEPQDDESEEVTAASDTSNTTLTPMAISTDTLATAKLQEQKENLKETETEKVQEQKQHETKEKLANKDQEDQVEADQENDLEQNDSTLDNTVQKENENQQKEQKASEKSKKSGGKGKN